MATTLEIAKSLLSPPGDTIQEHIDFIGMSQAELAERMGRPKEKINDIIKGREPITTATAFQLEKVLGIPASFWLNRENTYRKELYELQQQEEIKIADFDKKKFKDALVEIKKLAFSMPEDCTQQLQSICGQCGVAVVFTQNLPKAPISGATRWFHNKPIIQLSERFKTNDHFWFTFFHEAAHIILHGKKDIFLENVEGTEIDQEKEEEANSFAAKILLNES